MISSMTGFGRAEGSGEGFRITAEIKSVNHRYLDLSVRMPRNFAAFDPEVHQLLRDMLTRGKVDLAVTLEEEAVTGTLRYNRALAASYVRYLREMSVEFGIPDDCTASRVAAMPDVLTTGTGDADDSRYHEALMDTVKRTVENLIEARQTEGGKLAEDLQQKLTGLEVMREEAQQRAPGVVEDYRKRITVRMQEVLSGVPLDQERILTEAALYADRVCVDEEIVRLGTHIRHMKEALDQGGAVGRKLDFLAQEMNREANTALAKANDSSLADLAIGMKTEIEKIREQVQNIE